MIVGEKKERWVLVYLYVWYLAFIPSTSFAEKHGDGVWLFGFIIP